jgi:PIN domain nuclease of toxin-antitoxin system
LTFLDAYAMIAWLIGGPATEQVRTLLREDNAAIATVNLAETLDVAQRLYGIALARAMDLIEPLLGGPLTPVSLDVATATRAATLRARHYHRTKCPLSLADSILLACVRQTDRLATTDPHVLAVAADEGIVSLPLPRQG